MEEVAEFFTWSPKVQNKPSIYRKQRKFTPERTALIGGPFKAPRDISLQECSGGLWASAWRVARSTPAARMRAPPVQASGCLLLGAEFGCVPAAGHAAGARYVCAEQVDVRHVDSSSKAGHPEVGHAPSSLGSLPRPGLFSMTMGNSVSGGCGPRRAAHTTSALPDRAGHAFACFRVGDRSRVRVVRLGYHLAECESMFLSRSRVRIWESRVKR